MYAIIFQILNYTLSFLMWMVLGRVLLRLIIGDRPGSLVSGIFARITDPLYGLVRRLFPFVKESCVPAAAIVLVIGLRVVLYSAMPLPGVLLGDGFPPSNKTVTGGERNQAVDAFTAVMSGVGDGTAKLTQVVISGEHTGNVERNGVRLYRDSGSVPNEWDARDTPVSNGTTSFVNGVATFRGLDIEVTHSAAVYLVTYDIVANPEPGQDVTGYVVQASGTAVVRNNDTVDAHITTARRK